LTQVIADVDGDGRPDLIVGGEHQVTPFLNRGLQLEAGPALALATVGPDGTAVAPLAALAAGDLDGDGDVDLVIGHGTRLGERAGGGLSVAFNLGGGRFAPPVLTPEATIDVKALAIADLDRDGHPEIVTASQFGLTHPDDWKSVALWHVAADGSAHVASRREILPLLASILIVDLDGDGAPEVVLGQSASESVTIEWNDGKGGVAKASDQRAGWPVEALAAADLDGDGDLDLAAAASFSGDVTLLLNDGHRGFTVGAVLPGQDATGLVAADLDGRCGVDLIVAQSAGRLLGYFAGAFSP
jgi:hypothetical protein